MAAAVLCVVLFSVIYGSLGHVNYLEEVAHGKPTQQSGTKQYVSNSTRYDGNSSFAVDGKPVAGPNQTCSVTARSPNPWWMVDLQNVYYIQEVAVTPRQKSCVFKNFTISGSRFWDDSASKMLNPTLCYTSKNGLPVGLRSVLTCVNPVMGRYLKVDIFSKTDRALCICELEVYASSTDRFASFQSRPGKKSLDRRLRTIKTGKPVVCSAYCQEDLDCTSFNMAEEMGVCELNADSLDNLDATEGSELGWTRYVLD